MRNACSRVLRAASPRSVRERAPPEPSSPHVLIDPSSFAGFTPSWFHTGKGGTSPYRQCPADAPLREVCMIELLDQQKKLTPNQWKLIVTGNLADLLDFFDFFLIPSLLTFITPELHLTSRHR